MSEPEEDVGAEEEVPKAKIEPRRRTWMLWLIPLGALGLCGWFVYRDFIATGPTLTIFFRDVEGVQAGNTWIRYRGASVGRVKSLTLTKDGQFVRVKARMLGSAAMLARAGSIFWIVRPEVKMGGISGLRTIVSGEYINVEPGRGPATNTFVGADKAPVIQEAGALPIVLLSPHLGSMRPRSPVFYRGVQVGEVLGFQIGDDAQQVEIQARIMKEYAPLVRRNSVFWNAGGINFSFGLFRGGELSAESMSTLLTGGIEFATPENLQDVATPGTVFRLYEKPKDEWKDWAPRIRLQLPRQAPQPPAPFSPALSSE